MIWNIPNILTMARIAAAPLLALVFLVFERPLADWLAFGLFVGAAVTDFFDGWLARKLNQTSEIGKMLDPIADKVMVIIALMVLLWMHQSGEILVIPAVLIVLREVLVSGLREYLGDVKLSVTRLAKWKTTVQMTAIGVLLLVAPLLALEVQHAPNDGRLALGDLANKSGFVLLCLATVLTLLSGADYFRKGVSHIRARETG